MHLNRNQNLVILLISGLYLTTFGCFANADSPPVAQATCSLSLGVSDWQPYQKLSDEGIPTGLQVRLIQQLAREVGCHLTYKGMTFPEGLEELKKGTTDFLMNATPSEERNQYAHFSIPYRDEFLLLYSTEKYWNKCQSMTLEALVNDGFKLGLQEDLVYGPELTRLQNIPSINAKFHYVKDNVQHLQLVKDEGLDGVVDDPVVISYRSTVHTTGKALSSCPIVISKSPVSLIFSKRSVPLELVEKFNQAIEKIKQTEQYKKKWTW